MGKEWDANAYQGRRKHQPYKGSKEEKENKSRRGWNKK